MRHELRRQVADALARELRLEDEVRPAAEIDRHFGIRFVHRQQETVALDAALVAERFAQRLTQRQRDVLDRVVLVDVQIAGALHVEREAAVLAELLEHVVEEAEARLRARFGLAVEIDGDTDVGLFVRRCTVAVRGRSTSVCADASHVSAPGAAELEALDAEIACELDVGSRCRRPSPSARDRAAPH